MNIIFWRYEKALTNPVRAFSSPGKPLRGFPGEKAAADCARPAGTLAAERSFFDGKAAEKTD